MKEKEENIEINVNEASVLTVGKLLKIAFSIILIASVFSEPVYDLFDSSNLDQQEISMMDSDESDSEDNEEEKIDDDNKEAKSLEDIDDLSKTNNYKQVFVSIKNENDNRSSLCEIGITVPPPELS